VWAKASGAPIPFQKQLDFFESLQPFDEIPVRRTRFLTFFLQMNLGDKERILHGLRVYELGNLLDRIK
jgi:hypothetical protein